MDKKNLTTIVKAAAGLAGCKRGDLANALGISAQSVSDKYQRGSFSGADLVRIASACGFRLAFVDDSGKAVLTFPEPEKEG